jgi:MOSC domain-containing protein YiiM
MFGVTLNGLMIRFAIMKLLSLNVGLPRLVMRDGEPVSTGIFKEPVTGRIMLRTLNLDGDRQADLSVHGGPYKAVYAYPSEHYDFWRGEFPEMELPYGMFGENFTTEGLFETQVDIGDTFRLGGATVMVAQPRLPCYKLALRFGRSDILRRFMESKRSGIYFSVLTEGEVGVGDELVPLAKSRSHLNVVDILRLYSSDRRNTELMQRAVATEALPEDWREFFAERLEKLGAA